MPAKKLMTRRDYAKLAAEAHTNLSMFHSIIALCEGGGFYLGGSNPGQSSVSAIIRIAKVAAQRQLRAHDRAMAGLIGVP